MNGFQTYQLYVAIKNHFTNPQYDFFKYHGKVTARYNSYDRRPDRYFFEKFGQKYSAAKMIDFFVANFIENPQIWMGDFLDETADQIYLDWCRRVESLSYNFSEETYNLLEWLNNHKIKFNDLFRINGVDHPIIVKLALQHVISLETFVVLNRILGFCKRINTKLDDLIWEEFYHKVIKYDVFIQADTEKCKQILIKNIRANYSD